MPDQETQRVMRTPSLRVLVADDERAIRRLLRASLTAQGYAIFEASTGHEAIQGVLAHRPDALVLDLRLPDMEGIEVVRELREWTRLPVIVLSEREDDQDTVAVLDAGADDYVTKPFSVRELLARIRVALRHARPADEGSVFTSGDLTVDLSRRLVMVSERAVQLTATEYDLLRVLVTHAGKVVTHGQLLKEVWAGRRERTHLLRVHVRNLRGKLEAEPARPRYILTEPGVGYRLHLAA